MGMPMLKRFMSMQSERRHRQIRARARAGCVSSSLAKRKKEVCQHDDVSPSDKRLRCSGVNLPEKEQPRRIWGYYVPLGGRNQMSLCLQ
ncbi:uncharacterized protein [Triticum aestivum]|uniref:uncharacterized protein isoform X4 n=1 Tax=Triticum aestivum TaxID=4565 RepID=UPI001D02AE65|nr:uncharacterized protein LOC123164346 isoform X4 [Triticum aestivum]